MKKQKNIQFDSLPMKFNPGLKKYEPELPLKKLNKEIQIKVDWKWIWIIIITLLIFIGLFYWKIV